MGDYTVMLLLDSLCKRAISRQVDLGNKFDTGNDIHLLHKCYQILETYFIQKNELLRSVSTKGEKVTQLYLPYSF